MRERLLGLQRKHKTQTNKEEKETGLGGNEPTEFDVLIEEIINISNDTEQKSLEETNQKKVLAEKDQNAALQVRQVAMETMGETKLRQKKEEISPKPKRRRRSSAETFDFLKQKLAMDKENRQVELEERRNQNQLMLQILHQNNQQNQMIQQQMITMMQMFAEKNRHFTLEYIL